MHYTELLDKNKKVQLEIFDFFLYHESAVTFKTLDEHIEVSLPTLKNAVKDLNDSLHTFQPQAKLIKSKAETLELILPADFSVADFIYSYLKEAVDYRILLAVFTEKDISITKLAFDQHLSEASVFRHLKSLNQALKEFNIQIKKGNLSGNEWQIRLFYFQLFNGMIPLEKLTEELRKSPAAYLTDVIEQDFEFALSLKEQTKVSLWFAIMQHRLDYRKKPMTDFAANFIRQIKQDAFYQGLKNILGRFLSRFALSWSEEETVYFYLFFIAEGLLPKESKYWQQSSFIHYFLKIEQKITQVITGGQSGKERLPFLLAYHVRVTFYPGELLFLAKSQTLLSDFSSSKMAECMSFVEDHFSRNLSFSQWQVLDRLYGFTYKFYQRQMQTDRFIGVVCQADFQSEECLNFVSQSLAYDDHITVEKATDKYYDLLVVSHPMQAKNYNYQQMYLLTGSFSFFEKERLKKVAQKLLAGNKEVGK